MKATTTTRGALIAWLHLAVLWSFAFAKPLFDILADSPEFFVARGNTRGDILLFAFAMVLVPPTLALLVELLLWRLGKVREWVHLAFVGLLVAAIAVQLLDDLIGGSSGLLIPLSLAIGAAAAVAYARGPLVPTVLTVLGPLPAVFLILFLFSSGISKLVLPQDEGGGAAVKTSGSTPVVMLVLDEFRLPTLMDERENIDARRFPNFAALTRTGDFTWYRGATTVADQTTRAVPAILTGRVPRKGELPILADHPRNLFTMLSGSYSMNVTEAATALCPDDICKRKGEGTGKRLRSLAHDLGIVSLHRLFPSDLESHLPAVDQTFGGFGNDQLGANVSTTPDGGVNRSDRPQDTQRGAAVESFIRSIRPHSGKPPLDFMHVFLPHIPWLYLPSGQLYPDNGVGLPGQDVQIKGWGKDGWTKDPWPVNQAFQRFTLQAQYADRLVGDLVRRLRATGTYDKSLVVILADHGVSFHPGGPRRAVTQDDVGAIAGMPLFIKLPNQRSGRIDDSAVRTVDVLPTILDAIGAGRPSGFDGHSLLDANRDRPSQVSVAAANGDHVSLSFDDFLQARRDELRRGIDLIGTGAHNRLYAFGPHPELVGRPEAGLDVGQASGARVLLDGAQQYASLNPSAQVLPAFVTGRLSGVAAGRPLAVGVNGRIATTAPARELNGSVRLAAMVPESALRRGRNRISVYEIRGSGGATTLIPLQREATDTYKLVGSGGDETIVSSSGRRAQVVGGRGGGYLESLDLGGGGLRMGGWAATKSQGAAERVVVFVDGRFAAETTPGTDRPDVAKQFGPRSERSGFVINAQVPAGSEKSGAGDVRVFGIFGGGAVELAHPSGP